MDKDFLKLDHIRADRETYAALAQWVEEGNIDEQNPTMPLEAGVFFFDDEEYVLFERNGDVVRFLWFQSDVPFGRFEYDLQSFHLDNIGTTVELKPTDPPDAVYKPFWHIVHAYMGCMAFITMYSDNPHAVRVQKNGHQFTYHVDHRLVTLRPLGTIESVEKQIEHFLTFGHSANRR